ncbi:ribosomal protein S15 [Emydomyces testavorans]|uniref:Ribosomal protein S15 n=1 Tax=Emydomyces testavorans TaxID=2070801 RepID=A0AAF0DHR5_9EURO|nr:ribosomal protein S15 [Emydomyces testavorans]
MADAGYNAEEAAETKSLKRPLVLNIRGGGFAIFVSWLNLMHGRMVGTLAKSEALTGHIPTELKKKRTFKKFSYRGIDLEQLLDLSSEQLRDVVHARARRRFNRGLKRKPMGLIKKLRKAKQEAKPNEKPDLVKTHLRDMIVVPEMIGSVVGIYSGKEFNQVEIKPEMVGHYLGEFSIS